MATNCWVCAKEKVGGVKCHKHTESKVNDMQEYIISTDMEGEAVMAEISVGSPLTTFVKTKEAQAEIAELKAEIDDYKSLLLEVHRLFIKGRKLSTIPTEVLNWSARLSVLAKHKGE